MVGFKKVKRNLIRKEDVIWGDKREMRWCRNRLKILTVKEWFVAWIDKWINTFSTYLYRLFLNTLPAWCFLSCLLVPKFSSDTSLDLPSSIVLSPAASVFIPFFSLLHTLSSTLFLQLLCLRWCLWWCRWWWWWWRWFWHEFEFSVTIFINKATNKLTGFVSFCYYS